MHCFASKVERTVPLLLLVNLAFVPHSMHFSSAYSAYMLQRKQFSTVDAAFLKTQCSDSTVQTELQAIHKFACDCNARFLWAFSLG